MANPNVSAMTELTIGTLAWTITADQVTVFEGRAISRDSTSASTVDFDMHTPNTWNTPQGFETDIPNQFLFGYMCGHDTSDYAINDSSMKWVGSGGTAMTQLAHPSNGEYMVQKWGASNYGHNFTYYMKDADITNIAIGTAASRVWAEPDNGETMNKNILAAAGYFGNVDQTNPFSLIHEGYPWWSTGARYRLSPGFGRHHVPTQIGDLIIIAFVSDYYAYAATNEMGVHNLAKVMAANVTANSANSISLMYKSPVSYNEYVKPQIALGTYDVGGYNTFSYSSTNSWSIFNLQSPRTKTKLFTVPSGKMIKLNSLFITNPSVSGMYASIDIEGLPSGTGGILDSGGNPVITLTGADGTAAVATWSIASQLRAKSRTPVPALQQPVYLTEGMSLSAKVVCDEAYPDLLASTCQIVADFEVVQ